MNDALGDRYTMNPRRSFRSSTIAKRLAVSMSLPLFMIAGCGSESNTTDKAVVVVQDPAAISGSKSVPAPGGSAPAETAAPAEPAKTEAAAPAAAAAPAGGWGTFKGRVVFDGTVPAAKILVPKGGDKDTKDAAFCAKNEIDSDRLVVNKGNQGVRYALVYIPKPTQVNPEAAAAAKAAPVEFDQKDCKFTPHVLAAMKGATVTIKSSDSVGHNTNASGLNNNKFNLPTQPNSSTPWLLRGADKPGKIVCDIHNWMEAYWLVLDNPYFAVTDADGNFEIKNVPTGDQKVVVWAEALGPGFVTAASGDTVNIKAGDGTPPKEFKLEASRVK